MKIFRVCFFILLTIEVSAQKPKFIRHEINREERGLKISKICQSPEGFLWLGTQKGVYRYDGLSSKLYPFPLINKDESVTSIFTDNQGKIWAGTSLGNIYFIKNDRLLKFNPDEGLPKVPVNDIAQDTAGNIWFSTYGEGLYCFEDGRLFNISEEDGLTSDFNNCLSGSKEGFIWAGGENGISVCSFLNKKKNAHRYTPQGGLPDPIITSILEDSSGMIWLGTQDKGIYNFQLTRGFLRIIPELKEKLVDWKYGAITGILVSGRSVKIATDAAGLISLCTDETLHYQKSNSKISNKITDIFQDLEGNIWVADNSHELISYNELFTFKETTGSPDGVYALTRDLSNRLWFSDGKKLTCFDHGQPKPLTSNLSSLPAISAYTDAFGNLWFGTFGKGVYKYDPIKGELKNYTEYQGLVNNNVLSISGDGKHIWFATLGGLSRFTFSNSSFQSFTGKNTPGVDYIYQVYQDTRKRIWLATDGNGVILLQNGVFKKFGVKEGLKSRVIYSIAEDKQGHIWISSSQDGIYIFNGTSFKNFSLKEGLRSLSISSIAADQNGKLLIVSDKGIDIINTQTFEIMYHSEELGLEELEPNLNAIYKDSGGKIWIGAKKGLIKYDPSSEQLWEGPRPIIKDIQVFLKSEGLKNDVHFSHSNNHISFDYAGIWFHDPDEVRYQIKLDGYDQEWVESGNHFITYPQLPPGNYTFRLKASAGASFEGAKEVTYTFTIDKPFWRTWWFIGLVIITLGLAARAIFRFRLKKLQAEESAKKEKILFSLETLRSQVNPHFLFNSFNTLAGIIESDQEAAVEYVERLSDFYRNILKYQETDLILLDEELALLTNYYELQKKRYGDKLTLELDPKLKNSDLFIAPLTLQLLFENVLKHNVISNAEPMKVMIYRDQDYIVIGNEIKPKVSMEPVSGKGLSNIRSRYNLLFGKEVVIERSENKFVVKVPEIRK